jgi:mRNA-degrading endonuclease RelE of RelBE toxin-antitoxin system
LASNCAALRTKLPEIISRLKSLALLGTTWELRFAPNNRFRVFYEVKTETQTVEILAIGVKERDRLLIGREEYGG